MIYNPRIQIFCESEVQKIEGQPGKFDVTLRTPAGEQSLGAGAVIVATGWKPYDPTRLGALGYGQSPNVITSVELEKWRATRSPPSSRAASCSSSARARAIRNICPIAPPSAAWRNNTAIFVARPRALDAARRFASRRPDDRRPSDLFQFHIGDHVGLGRNRGFPGLSVGLPAGRHHHSPALRACSPDGVRKVTTWTWIFCLGITRLECEGYRLPMRVA